MKTANWLARVALAFVVSVVLSCKPAPTPGPGPTPAPSPGPASQVLCGLVSAAEVAASQAVASALSCANPAVIASDLTTAIGNLGLCPVAGNLPKLPGAIGQLVCPAVGRFIQQAAVAQIPPDWQCTGGPVTAVVIPGIVSACEAALAKY